jgi:hypothetical protein
MKYVFIEKHQAEFSIKAMCRVLRVARSGWYTWCQRRTRRKARVSSSETATALSSRLLPGQLRYGAHA